MLSDKGLDLIRSTTCKDPCRECAEKQVLLAEIDQLRADCNTLQASVALYFRENKQQLEMDKLDVANLKALLREAKEKCGCIDYWRCDVCRKIEEALK